MFARTERLLLRPGFPEDAPQLARAIGDERIARNVARMPWPYCLSDAERFLEKFEDARNTTFLIFERTDAAPKLVGGCGFDHRLDGSLQFGYWITPAKWGRGFATEAGRATLDIARTLRVKRLQAGHFIDNPASGRVLEKLGFRPTGRTVPCFSLGRGRESQTRMFALDLVEEETPSAIAA
ncbi:GNAT family N-acetyltransferase [Sphingomicrobium clamense]|uniref:GNAT family N-acetyltransferase n=1 Tax=Sphingomicrobium clamense TaxID=2851013 RepID=A0ABS6V861_9SPHN|nr:GNAT family N-acetyltransferase [Sphingomicrobium sp. B8]MBW0145704.1 GNAT family N-acetyltransferase [Sphingomicrobium sp. B8]